MYKRLYNPSNTLIDVHFEGEHIKIEPKGFIYLNPVLGDKVHENMVALEGCYVDEKPEPKKKEEVKKEEPKKEHKSAKKPKK